MKSLFIIHEAHEIVSSGYVFPCSNFGSSSIWIGPGESSGDPAGVRVVCVAPGRICLRGALMAAGDGPDGAQRLLEPRVLSSLKFIYQKRILVLELLESSRFRRQGKK